MIGYILKRLLAGFAFVLLPLVVGFVSATSRLADAEIERSRVQAQLDGLAPRWADAQRQREELQALEAEMRVSKTLRAKADEYKRTVDPLVALAAAALLAASACDARPLRGLAQDDGDAAVHPGATEVVEEILRELGPARGGRPA